MKNMVVVVQDKRITMKEKILAVVTLVVVGIIMILEISGQQQSNEGG